jgi:vacuolar-type H+-ATPase subunit B/Vma2
MSMLVPEGVNKLDAREIIEEKKIFKTDNSYGPFADMFRYKMIQQTGLTWTDTDNICLQKKWKFPEYLFGMQGGPHKIVANGVLKAPKDSEFIVG